MKKLLFICVGLLLVSTIVGAQNNNGKANDKERIALAIVVDDQEMPMSAKNMLENKMRQIATLNGLAGEGSNPLFSMKATIDVVNKEFTATIPHMCSMNMTVNFFIVDNENGNVYSQTSVDIKGAGQNETKAYSQAIKGIDTKKGQYKAFVEQGKNKIVEYYNSQCDIVISKAKLLNSQGKTDEAKEVLSSVPSVCKECADLCTQVAEELFGAASTPTSTPTTETTIE